MLVTEANNQLPRENRFNASTLQEAVDYLESNIQTVEEARILHDQYTYANLMLGATSPDGQVVSATYISPDPETGEFIPSSYRPTVKEWEAFDPVQRIYEENNAECVAEKLLETLWQRAKQIKRNDPPDSTSQSR